MSGNAGDQKATTGEPQREHYPPPPPGQPPSHQPAFQHPNETPIPDYNIPAYDPSHPHFAPPPDDSSLYDEPPSAAGQQGGRNAGGAKASWSDRLTAFGQQAAAPFNALANKMGSEAFLPTTMDKECEKAARILRSFCKDGIYSDSAPGTVPANRPSQPPSGHASGATQNRGASTGSKPKDRVLLTIPSKVISKAVGLAIFTTARAGFHVSGATGSGVLIARLPDGSWSPPSGIQVHSVGAGFVIGIDIYDCVVVINTREALHAFTQTRMSLGSDLAVTAGPWGAGGSVDFAPGPAGKGKARESPKDGPAPAAVARPPHSQPQAQHPPNLVPPQSSQGQPGVNTGPGTAPAGTTSTSRPGSSSRERKPSPFREAIKSTKPVYSYVKSRGFYAGVQVDGTVVTERKDANADFYGARVSVGQILRGEVPPQGPAGQWPAAARGLVEVLRGAEGWHGQQQQRGQAAGVAGVASGIGRMDLGTGGAGQQSGPYSSKAEEAAAEARPAAASEPEGGAPPSYAEPTGEAGGDDLPPAYVDDGRARPGDAKSSYQ